ncbi:uncharacterized protein B0P05DRAFT_555036 [Gilbertella persicaria]|uniref:uncharacterized protein n=1 Tax=Gilbertella persicaria TaxID=101096 RepID=UPI00221F397B|nr:uncharacterized protein B0P05DRAFT_555036 [Gilbertella persicaria]KAI8064332.1 hypothetical protein B0P05DRAFT_555036 [Gilbertella persicaria]
MLGHLVLIKIPSPVVCGFLDDGENIKEFLSKQRNITKIIIDRLPITSEVEIYETEVLL